ncbi:MAG TPA: HEAT repeat domain-containing protein [Gemmataceae bacterium]|jgi:HEAT repeat protein|nr:HEAT repeat domain-containing protein [Gemmataceae bacterium]
MRATRVLGLFILALMLTVAADNAQPGQPGVKTQPQIKPGGPGVGGVPKVPVDPGKNPIPMVPVGGGAADPKNPGTTSGSTPGKAPLPEKKKDNVKWPEKINGKTVEDCIKEMRTNPDPVVRESAVRTLPLFGPVSREKGWDNLLYAMTRDPDINVKMTALSVAPSVVIGFAEAVDQVLMDGTKAIVNYLDSDSVHIKYDAVQAVMACGPYIKTAQPQVVPKLSFRMREPSSYIVRRAAVAALAVIGQGIPPGPETGKGLDPDQMCVTNLLEVMQKDVCVVVRKEAVSGLIAMGPVAQAQQKQWKTVLENLLKPGAEKDKSMQIWIRVLIIHNDPNGLKGNEAHLNAIAEGLKSQDDGVQVECCQALGTIGEDAKTKLQGILDLIADPTEKPEVVAAAITATLGMKSQSAISLPVVQKATMHVNPDVARIAREAVDILMGKKK